MSHVVDKYFHNAISASVTLEKADEGFTVRTRVNLTRRMELESTGQARDAHAALDAAIEHAEKRLRRHKRRLKNHRQAAAQSMMLTVAHGSISCADYIWQNEMPEDVIPWQIHYCNRLYG